MGLTFQVAAVKKPLISVKRITEKGNKVCFGPGENESYIENNETEFVRNSGRRKSLACKLKNLILR